MIFRLLHSAVRHRKLSSNFALPSLAELSVPFSHFPDSEWLACTGIRWNIAEKINSCSCCWTSVSCCHSFWWFCGSNRLAGRIWRIGCSRAWRHHCEYYLSCPFCTIESHHTSHDHFQIDVTWIRHHSFAIHHFDCCASLRVDADLLASLFEHCTRSSGGAEERSGTYNQCRFTEKGEGRQQIS